jgi:hypothetical protein
MKLILLTLVCLGLALCACSKPAANSASTAPSNAAKLEPIKAVSTLKPGETPFEGFTNLGTTAKAGENVLAMDQGKINEIAGDPKNATALFYNRVMVAPGEVESEIEDPFHQKFKVPNAYIIPLAKGGKAKAGDIVLTWWQSGGGIYRGYVVEASNPQEPTVRYLDMPNDANKQDKLKPDSFVVIREPFQPGNIIAVKNEGHMDSVQVIRVEGDRVLTQGFARKIKVFAKADATAVPLNPKVKAGDKVQALFFSYYEPATVVSVDEKLGTVTVRKDGGSEDKVLDFGDIMK